MWYVQVPSPPASLLHRIKCVEEHIIQLERDYPPWAALHFNQPRRGVRITRPYHFALCLTYPC